jgi:hypothetical protein
MCAVLKVVYNVGSKRNTLKLKHFYKRFFLSPFNGEVTDE